MNNSNGGSQGAVAALDRRTKQGEAKGEPTRGDISAIPNFEVKCDVIRVNKKRQNCFWGKTQFLKIEAIRKLPNFRNDMKGVFLGGRHTSFVASKVNESSNLCNLEFNGDPRSCFGLFAEAKSHSVYLRAAGYREF